MGARSQRGIAVALACALALAACFGDERPAVQTERATSGVVTETVTAPARVDASARQDVAAALSGVVIALEVDDGEHVDEGQVVVRLESTQVDLAREQAEAARQAARRAGGIQVDGQGGATVETVERAVADLDEEIRPRIAQSRAEAEAIEDEPQRMAALAAIEAVETSYLTTRAGLLATGAAIASQQDAIARSLSGALNEAIAQATAAQRAQAEAAARAAEAQVDDLALAAPFAGTVQLGEAAATDGVALPGELPAELSGMAGAFGAIPDGGGGTLRVGAPVIAGQTLFTVFDLSEKYVNADVDEVDAPHVAIGQRATVLVDAFPEVEFAGLVEGLRVEASTTEAGGVGYRARVHLLAPAEGRDEALADALELLRVGMTASAEIATREVEADTVVPSRALLRREEGTVVFTVRDGVAHQVPVRVLALGEERAAVEGAVERGDRIVVSGYEELVDGAEVVRE